MIRFGILGCGAHGERYLRHLKAGDVPGAVPVALWRRDRGAAQVLAARYGVQAHPAWRDLIEDPAVDAVIVATPPGLHPEPILAAARIGKPVLAEKPLAANLAQALALAAALPDDARVMVAHTLRFSPALITAHELLPELGDVHRIRVASPRAVVLLTGCLADAVARGMVPFEPVDAVDVFRAPRRGEGEALFFRRAGDAVAVEHTDGFAFVQADQQPLVAGDRPGAFGIGLRVDADLEVDRVAGLEQLVRIVAGVAQRLPAVHPPGDVEILVVRPHGEGAACAEGRELVGVPPLGKVAVRLDRGGG
jgi:hypothetical protein